MPEPAHPAASLDEDVLELRPSRRRWGALLLVGLGFIALGAWMLAEGEGFGWFVLLLFGACTAVAGSQLLPGSAWLRLSPGGIEWRTLGRHHRYGWHEVDHFRTVTTTTQYGSNDLVGFDLVGVARARTSAWQRVTRSFSGVDDALPDTYGRDADELAKLLQGWRDRHAGIADGG